MSANRFLSWLLLAGGALMAGVAGAQPIERWTQPDGARVLFVPSHQNPIIDIRIDVDAGSRREAPGRLGVAALTNRLLASGTRKHDEEALSAAWADRSMQYGASVDQDRAAAFTAAGVAAIPSLVELVELVESLNFTPPRVELVAAGSV